MTRRAREQLGRLLERWTAVVARRPTLVLLVAVLAGALGLWAAVNGLGLNTDTAEMLSAELPFRKAWDRYAHAFPQLNDTVIVVVESSTPEIADDTADALLAELARRDDLLDDVHRPDGGAFLRRHGLMLLNVEDLQRLAGGITRGQSMIDRLHADPSLPVLLDLLAAGLAPEARDRGLDVGPILAGFDAAVKARLTGRTYLLSWQELLAGDPGTDPVHRRFIVAKPRLDYDRLFPAEETLDAIRVIVRDTETRTDDLVRVHLTGPAALAHDEMTTVSRGALRTTLLALAMVGLVLWAALRSVRLIIATLVTLVIGLLITAGIAAVTVGRLNMISVAFAVLYVGLGVDYAIHLCLRYRELIERGHRSFTALRGSVHNIGPALALCAVSTAIGFFSFTPTSFRGVSELGLIAGLGMFVSLAVTLTVLPALLALLPLPRRPVPEGPPRHRTLPLLNALDRGRVPIRWAALVIAIACAAVLPGATFDYSPINLQDPDVESVAVLRALGASDRVAPSSIAIVEPDAETARRRAVRLRTLPLVRRVVTLDDYVATDQPRKLEIIRSLDPRLGAAPPDGATPIHTDLERRDAVERLDATLAATGGDRTLVSALLRHLDGADEPERASVLADIERSMLATFSIAMSRLRDALGAEAYTIDDLPAELRARWISADGVHRVEVIPTADVTDSANLRAFVSEVRVVAPHATGEPVVLLEAGEAVIRAFVQAFVGALVAIAILLTLLRNLREALLVLCPLLLAGALTGAASVVLDIPFNFANVIALPLLLGIGVDSGIHIVQRMHGGAEPPEALLHTSTARAVVYSAFTTIMSFGNLAFTAHRGTASMGQLLTLGIVFTLLTTLIMLPAFLPAPRSPTATNAP
ncbi:MAG: MMPL family transporter [Planctomycetes bacterium]|nr:MMPL family transporter [Planctomycetota bacterium]